MEEGAAGDCGAHNEEHFPDLTAFSPHDVIFGKGNGINGLPGNLLFRSIIHRYKPTYASAPRNAKGSIAEKVIDEIGQLGGRFLEPQSDNKSFREVCRKRAVEKTCQALRERDKRSVYQSTGYYDHPYSSEPFPYYHPTMDSGAAHHHNQSNDDEASMNGESSRVVNTVTANNSEDPLQKESPPSNKSDPGKDEVSNSHVHSMQGNHSEGDGASSVLEENDGGSRKAIEPRDNDVLYGGRGRKHFHRVANQRYLEMIKFSRQEYQNSRSKKRVALRIIQQWRQQQPPGRFLQQDSADGNWYEIPQNKILEKTCQALRDLKRERGPGVVRPTIADRMVDPRLIPMVPRPPPRRVPHQPANMNHPGHHYDPHAGYYPPHPGYAPGAPPMAHGYPPMHQPHGFPAMYGYMPPPESQQAMPGHHGTGVDLSDAGGNRELSPSRHNAPGDDTNKESFSSHCTIQDSLKSKQADTSSSVEPDESMNESQASQRSTQQSEDPVMTSDPDAIQRQAAVVAQEMRKMDDMMRLASSSGIYSPGMPNTGHVGLPQPPSLGGRLPESPNESLGISIHKRGDTTIPEGNSQNYHHPSPEKTSDRNQEGSSEALAADDQNFTDDANLLEHGNDCKEDSKNSTATDIAQELSASSERNTRTDTPIEMQAVKVSQSVSAATEAPDSLIEPPKKKQKREQEAADILVNLSVPNAKEPEKSQG